MQGMIKWLLFAAATEQIHAQGQPIVYGAVEEDLADRFQRDGMEATRLSEPKYVEEFNAVKLPLVIDTDDLFDKLHVVMPDLMRDTPLLGERFVYNGTLPEVPKTQPAKVAVA